MLSLQESPAGEARSAFCPYGFDSWLRPLWLGCSRYLMIFLVAGLVFFG
jgi:hypothetical protein